MFAVPAVSTAVASDATRPGVPAAFFGVDDGVAVGLAVPELAPALAGELEDGLADEPSNGRPSEGLGAGVPADEGLGVGEGEPLGRQMMPRMHP
jgi:hypothetical protein